MTPRSKSRGTVLPIVLLLSSMMLVTAGAWLETSIVATRSAASLRDRVQAFHAADSALARCGRMAVDSPDPPQNASTNEPAGWRVKASFEGAGASAIAPFAAWPYALRVPQCLIESWSRSGDVDARSYLVTARGFGASGDAESWLQLEIEVAGNSVTRRWRRVVAKPF